MKFFLKIIIFIVIIMFFYLYLFKEGGIFIFKDIKDDYNIINSKEEDQDIIAEYFVKGMKTNDYINSLDKKTKILEKKDLKYTQISYDFETVLKYQQIEDIINQLNRSDATKVEIIGKSVDKRKIYSLSLGFGDNIILIDGSIHAAEIANSLFILKFMIDLINKYENNDSEIINILNNVKIVVIPNINPDGYEVCLFGADSIKNHNLYLYKHQDNIIFKTYKANANGVDLNRNFPSQHGGLYYKVNNLSEAVSDNPTTGYFDYYPGKTLGSEPEVKALIYWFNKYLNKSFAYLSFHSAGRVVYSGKPNLSSLYNKSSLKLAEIINQVNDYKAYDHEYEDVGYGNDGTSTDYASELVSGFKFSNSTGRLSANKYIKAQVRESEVGIITIETLEEYTFDIDVIKSEYYNQNLEQAIMNIINLKK
ncbi:MAG: M14 family metallopeptidase [Bacilli bacterium]|nr:M14 family metallopeptidase [Bacilli bacterium]